MDFDGDGIDDLISGSYDPGEFYLFRGIGLGQFKARETLTDKDGKSILTSPHQKVPWESFGSWVAMVDWDDDGDLDLVLGTYGGGVLLRMNEGSRTKPAFASDNIPVRVDGEDLSVPGAHATPVIADWDGDGLWDFLSGSGTGAVYWYRNAGRKGEPKLSPPVRLVPEHVGNGYSDFLDAGEEPVPGIRSQIAVADYDDDGRLDLLVGDFCQTIVPRADLSPREREEMLAIRNKIAAAEGAMQPLQEKFNEAFREYAKQFPEETITDKDVQEKLRAKQQELGEEPAYKAASDEYQKQTAALKRYLAPPSARGVGDDTATPHGYVWVYLRQ